MWAVRVSSWVKKRTDVNEAYLTTAPDDDEARMDAVLDESASSE
jgi:hypothetical protein